jgi:hypothetical protein
MSANYDFSIDQGTNHSFEILYKNADGSVFDFTAFTAKLQVRKTVSAVDVLIELVSPTDLILNNSLGKITVNFLPSHTIPLANTIQKLVYDLEINNGVTNVIRIIQGTLTLSPEVTR